MFVQGPFIVSSGPCTATDGGRCVGRRNGYSDNEDCVIKARRSATVASCPVFSTEEPADYLAIDGVQYSKTSCPLGKVISAASAISWHSDYSNHAGKWEICV